MSKAEHTSSLSSFRHHATTDHDFNEEESEYMQAMQNYKASTGKKFPTICDHLHVAKLLGYSKPEATHSGFLTNLANEECMAFS